MILNYIYKKIAHEKENIDLKSTMVSSGYFRDRRKYPRVCVDLPLEYRMKYDPRARGGVVLDASEAGFLIYSIQDIPVGTELKIAVLFAKEYELADFELFAKIVWKKVSLRKREKGYQYGLKLMGILAEDYRELRGVLGGTSQNWQLSEGF